MRYKTIEQVIAALKLTAKRQHQANVKAFHTLRANDQSVPYPVEKNYRQIGGNFIKRDGVFRTERYWFDPIALKATSYSWWSMLIVRNGKLIRNRCGYSCQTRQHQRNLDRALKALNIKPDIEVWTRANIGSAKHWQDMLLGDWARAMVGLKYCQKRSRQSWRSQVDRCEREMKRLVAAKIGLKFTAKDKREAIASAESFRRSKLDWMKRRKEHRVERQQKRVVNQSPVMQEQPISPPARRHLSIVRSEP